MLASELWVFRHTRRTPQNTTFRVSLLDCCLYQGAGHRYDRECRKHGRTLPSTASPSLFQRAQALLPGERGRRSRVRCPAATYPPSELRLTPPARNGNKLGFRLVVERFFQDFREPRLTFWNPTRVVLANNFLGIADQFRYIRDRHALLKKDAHKSVAQSMWSRTFIKWTRQAAQPAKFHPPYFRHC